jgi:sugar/nucleoside kinase (ribokinase family)
LYLGGYLLMPALTAEAAADLFRRARAAGVKTVLDVAIAPTTELWERIAAVLPYTDLFFPNEDEARLMTGVDDVREQAQQFRAAGAGTVVITRGHTGTVLAGDGELIEAGVFPVSFVDGTGSGDAFDAGFVLGMLEGRSNADCLRLGSALGASCVRHIGATAGVFTRTELDAFLREHELPLG